MSSNRGGRGGFRGREGFSAVENNNNNNQKKTTDANNHHQKRGGRNRKNKDQQNNNGTTANKIQEPMTLYGPKISKLTEVSHIE